MVIAATIFSWVLAVAADHQTPTEFVDELAYVERVETGGEDVQVVAYDASGEVIAVVALWTEDGRSHVVSDFTDGYEEIVVIGDEVHRESSLAPGVAGDRAQAMLDLVAPSDPQEGKVGCVLTILTSAAACSPVSVASAIGAFSCPPSVYLALCECAEFLGKKPPEEWC